MVKSELGACCMSSEARVVSNWIVDSLELTFAATSPGRASRQIWACRSDRIDFRRCSAVSCLRVVIRCLPPSVESTAGFGSIWTGPK